MIMSRTKKILNFTAAVRGFHNYQKIWSSNEREILNCYHERDNAFDVFATKTKSKMDLLLDIYPDKYLELPNFYQIKVQR